MNALTQEFNSLATRLAQRLGELGSPIEPFSPGKRFSDLTLEEQKTSIKRVRMQLEQAEIIQPNMNEHEKFTLLSTYHRLQPVDKSTFTKLDLNLVWEIIDFNLNQLYRNHSFMKIGGYSVEEYEAYPVWEQYTRPRAALEELMRLTQILKTSKSVMDLGHMKPYIAEAALQPDKPKFELKHEFAVPLEDPLTGENVAFISAVRARRLDPVIGKRILLMS